MPLLYWSVLDRFRKNRAFVGGDASSVVMSPQAKWTAALNDEADGTVISPDLKNTKKQELAAAHSMASSNVRVVVDQFACKARRISIVIGSRVGWGEPRSECLIEPAVGVVVAPDECRAYRL